MCKGLTIQDRVDDQYGGSTYTYYHCKKKLQKTLSRKKSVRQQSIEDDISAYSRSEDSHTTYEGGAVML